MAVPAPYSIFNMINKYINNMLYHVLTHINASNLTLLMIDHILTIVDETWLLSGHLILIRSIMESLQSKAQYENHIEANFRY